MNTATSPDGLEQRVVDTLESTTDAMPDSTPPAFSWQNEAPQQRSRGSRRAVYAGAGLVAAAVAAALVVSALPAEHTTSGSPQAGNGSQSQQHAAPQSAPKLLLAAARVRRQNGYPALAAGQYRYVRIVSPAPDTVTTPTATDPGSGHTQSPPPGSYTLDEYWIPKDQTDVWLRRQSVVGDPDGGAPLVFSGRCDDLYAGTQDGPAGPACTRPGGFDDPTPAFIAALPRDVDGLYGQLHAYAAQHLNPDKIDDVNYEMFSVIDSLLASGVITSDLTSTLYGVLSRIPGITVINGARNYSGVAGTGFELSTQLGHAYRATSTIIVDLDSGAYLGDRQVSAGVDYASAVTTGVADRIGHTGH